MSTLCVRTLLLALVLVACLVAQAAGQACTSVSGTTGGDFAVAALVTRQPVLSVNFTSSPSCATGVASNWPWAASDPSDNATVAALHQGVALLNGTASQWIDLTTASGPQSAGAVLPLFGGRGFDGSGWSIEMVVKFPSTTTNVGNGACLFLFQDAADDWTTIVWDSTYDAGDTDSGNRLTANQYSNQTFTGLPIAATGATIEFFAPVPGQWYHITWTMAPSPSLAAGTAVWSLYINGRLLNYAAALVPSSTLTPIQGANMPPASVRTIASLAKDSFADTMVVTIDAFRVYDYLLPAATVQSLANAYGLLAPVSVQPTSYQYAPSTETTRLNSLVPTAPIFNANFAVNPTANLAIPFTAYQWAAADPSDTPAMQALHPGVVLLNGSASSFINLQQASGPNSCGLVLPIIGTAGSGTGSSQGLSFEMVFKFPVGYTILQSSKLFDLGQGGTETIDLAAQTSGSLQLEQQNNVQPGLESSSYQATYTAQGSFSQTGVWNHVVWVLSSPNFSNYSATWTLYLNGQVMPFITAYSGLYPLPVYRPLSYIGGSDYYNANLPLTVDAFRIYDYALSATTISNVCSDQTRPRAFIGCYNFGGPFRTLTAWCVGWSECLTQLIWR